MSGEVEFVQGIRSAKQYTTIPVWWGFKQLWLSPGQNINMRIIIEKRKVTESIHSRQRYVKCNTVSPIVWLKKLQVS